MKKLLVMLASIYFSFNVCYSQDKSCTREAYFGGSKICLPTIEGYQECYSDSIINHLADGSEVAANNVLGFYLNNQTYQVKDSLDSINFDDYFKIYGTKELQHYKADTQLVNQLEGMLNQNFVEHEWDDMSEQIEKLELDMKVGVPVFIEKFTLNDASFSIIMLVKYNKQGVEPYTLAMTVNGYVHNERFIWMAYYLKYQGFDTIEELKNRSNAILKKLMFVKE